MAMKKQITYIALSLVGLLGTWSCNKRTVGEVEKYPVRFSVANMTSKLADDKFSVGDVIGIYACPTGNSILGSGDLFRKNVPYVQMNNGELLVQAGNEPISFPEVDRLDFVGYYPYSQEVDAQGTMFVDLGDQTKGMSGVVLYSDNQKGVSRTWNYVELEFRYLVAQVVFNVQFDPATMPNASLSSIRSVTFTGDGLEAGYDFEVGTGRIVLTNDGVGTGARGRLRLQPAVAECKAAIFPASVRNLKIEVETANYTYEAKPQDITYAEGTKYTYNLTLKDGGIAVLSNVKIHDWEPGNGEGGAHIAGTEQ